MSFDTMARELSGDVPGLPFPLAKTYLARALDRICDEQRWSFQVGEGGWLTPGLLGGSGSAAPGTITVNPYDTAIVGDATATAAWAALVGRPLITEQQIRIPGFSLYNIVAYDDGTEESSPNPGFATLTIDRPWMEPGQSNAGYMIYQAYFPVPVPGFRRFGYMRDMTNNAPMNYRKYDQAWLNRHDPQRAYFDTPSIAVPYKIDARPNSATLGQMMYELWPHPLTRLPYNFSYVSRGAQLVNPTDTVPYPLTEELVIWRAKEYACLWKESQKQDGLERGSGADWKFLAQDAHEQFSGVLKQAKLLDGDIGDLYWNKFERTSNFHDFSDAYVSVNGTMSVGF